MSDGVRLSPSKKCAFVEHAEWRKAAKKARRKKIRKKLATERDNLIRIEENKKLNSPKYQSWLKEQQELEDFTAHEEKLVRDLREKKWIEDEKIAQEKWSKQQEIKQLEHLKKAAQQKLIREEWEKEQKKEEEEKERKKREEETKKEKMDLLIAQIDEYIKGERDDIPEEFNVQSETQPGKLLCPFFSKTGACRYKNECSRNHVRPGISKTLLFPGFYSHFSLEGVRHLEYDTDISLEYEYSETYKHFVEFYFDIKEELDKYGRLTQLIVCLNTSSHLRGNVYVSFSTEREALTVFRRFNGRYYAGRPISAEFINIPLWKTALCGLQYTNKCPKGGACNFLHTFKNPGRQFHNADRLSKLSQKNNREEWRWSESPPNNVRDHQRDRKRRRSNERHSSRKHSSRRSNSRSRSHRKSTRRRRSYNKKNNHHSRSKSDRRSRSSRNSDSDSESSHEATAADFSDSN